MTLQEKFPYLFVTYALDEGGRPESAPTKDDPNALKVLAPRTPSAVEVVTATLSQFGYPVGASVAATIVADLDAYYKLTTPQAGPAPAPPTPPPPATPTAAPPAPAAPATVPPTGATP